MGYRIAAAGLMILITASGCRQVNMPVPESYAPPPMPAVDGSSMFAPAGRKVSFKVSRNMKVDDAKAFGREVLGIVNGAGGIVTQYQRNLLEVMIPVADAERVIGEIDRLGTVTRKGFVGHNFTELMNSFDIRLNDLTRQKIRLTRLWNRAGSIEDLMRIERELAANSADYARMMSSMRETLDKISNVTLSIKIE